MGARVVLATLAGTLFAMSLLLLLLLLLLYCYYCYCTAIATATATAIATAAAALLWLLHTSVSDVVNSMYDDVYYSSIRHYINQAM